VKLQSCLTALVLVIAAFMTLNSTPVPGGVHAASLPALPPGWPGTFQLGTFDSPGGAAAMKAVAPFQFRYQYLAGGVNTGNGWANWNANGQFATFYIQDSVNNGITPVFTYYMLCQSSPANGCPSSDESAANFTNLQNSSTMIAYYNDFKLLLQKAAAFPSKPVIIQVEPDLWGFMHNRSSSDDASTLTAKVAATGLTDLAGLPNNLRGFAQALVHLRDVYAPNVLLAYGLSVWGAGNDIVYSNPSNSVVDQLATRSGNFYKSLQANFDVVFSDPADRDAAFKQYQYGDGGAAWWDSGDYARNVRFLGTFVSVAQKRVVLWQIPQGNTKMRALNNTWNHYQDNHVEWWLDDPGRTHLTEYLNAGVVALLFGRGADGATCACDANNDGITNPAAINGNTGMSLNSDDDGGFFKQKTAAYYTAGAMSLGGGTAPLYGVSWTADNTPASMNAGATGNVTLSFTNTGSATWNNAGTNPARLSYHWRSGACPGTTTSVWDGLRTNLPANVAAGNSVANLVAQVRAPNSAGTYCLQYDLVKEGVTWLSTQGANVLNKTVTVSSSTYGVSWTADNTPASMNAGATGNVTLSFTNTGSTTWNNAGTNPVRLSYHWRSGACPGAATSVWDGLRTNLPANVAAGNSVTNLVAQVPAPNAAGTYCLQYDLVKEGLTWFSTQAASVLNKTVTVSGSAYGVSWTADNTPASMSANATSNATLSFTNTGSATWNNSGTNPVRLSYHWRTGACAGTASAVWDGLRTNLPANVAAGNSVTGLVAQVRAPASAGTYCLQYDLVKEGLTWFSSQAASVLNKTVTITP